MKLFCDFGAVGLVTVFPEDDRVRLVPRQHELGGCLNAHAVYFAGRTWWIGIDSYLLGVPTNQARAPTGETQAEYEKNRANSHVVDGIRPSTGSRTDNLPLL